MDIVRLTNADAGFYTIMGPFLARRNIENEIGYRMYDEEGKEWFVAMLNQTVIGFCYRHKGQIGSCYVTEEYRNKGVFGKLLSEAIDCKEPLLITTKNENLVKLLVEKEFKKLDKRGSYTRFKREEK